MSAKRDKFTKGRRSKPVTMGKLMRKNTTSEKSSAVRSSRKQRDIKGEGASRSVVKRPRRQPATGTPKQRM